MSNNTRRRKLLRIKREIEEVSGKVITKQRFEEGVTQMEEALAKMRADGAPYIDYYSDLLQVWKNLEEVV